MKRITGWLNPWKDPLETGYNLIQSYYAIGSGGLFGVGLGNSIQKLYYLPFQHTDFIFSVICEEWGFIGATIVIGLFLLLAWRGFTISRQCPSRFGKMLAFGLTLAILLQAMINISVTIGLMPVTGVTLPLISYGGTSMIVTLGMIGILLNISRYRSTARHPQEVY
jgi:cell division protein FtsW